MSLAEQGFGSESPTEACTEEFPKTSQTLLGVLYSGTVQAVHLHGVDPGTQPGANDRTRRYKDSVVKTQKEIR